MLEVKVKGQEVISRKEQLKALGKIGDWHGYIKKLGSAQAIRLELVLKMLSRKENLLRIEDENGGIDKNTTNEVVIPLRLQTGILSKAFKGIQLKFKGSVTKPWPAIRYS